MKAVAVSWLLFWYFSNCLKNYFKNVTTVNALPLKTELNKNIHPLNTYVVFVTRCIQIFRVWWFSWYCDYYLLYVFPKIFFKISFLKTFFFKNVKTLMIFLMLWLLFALCFPQEPFSPSLRNLFVLPGKELQPPGLEN